MTWYYADMQNRPHKLGTVGAYTRGITSGHAKTLIRRIFGTACKAHGLGALRVGCRGEARRNLLQKAIFAVEDRLESKAGGRPDDTLVLQLHAARLLVERDLSWEC